MQNLEQIYALEHLFQSSTPVQAARTVLSGQLLSGGISLRKEGEDIELTPEFKQHLHEVWIPFAQDIIDCMPAAFLSFGFAFSPPPSLAAPPPLAAPPLP